MCNSKYFQQAKKKRQGEIRNREIGAELTTLRLLCKDITGNFGDHQNEYCTLLCMIHLNAHCTQRKLFVYMNNTFLEFYGKSPDIQFIAYN